MKTNRCQWLVLMMSFSVSFAQAATHYFVKEGKSNLSFEASGRPSMLKIKGQSSQIKGDVSVENLQAHGDLELDLKSLDTGIDLRDKHMKEKYLQVDQYPKALLKINELKIESPDSLKSGRRDFDGLLTLHGVEHPVHGSFAVTGANEVEAQFEFKLSDFKIEIPTYMGITVADLVKVQSELQLEKKK